MINEALSAILPIAGWPEERARAVEITGGTDPILPTPFRIGDTSAAALAALGLAVSDLWESRTGRRQERGRCPAGDGLVPQRALHDDEDRAGPTRR